MVSQKKIEKGLVEEAMYWMIVHESGMFRDKDMHGDCHLRTNVHCGNCPIADKKAPSHSIPCPKEIDIYMEKPTAASHNKVIAKMVDTFNEVAS